MIAELGLGFPWSRCNSSPWSRSCAPSGFFLPFFSVAMFHSISQSKTLYNPDYALFILSTLTPHSSGFRDIMMYIKKYTCKAVGWCGTLASSFLLRPWPQQIQVGTRSRVDWEGVNLCIFQCQCSITQHCHFVSDAWVWGNTLRNSTYHIAEICFTQLLTKHPMWFVMCFKGALMGPFGVFWRWCGMHYTYGAARFLQGSSYKKLQLYVRK